MNRFTASISLGLALHAGGLSPAVQAAATGAASTPAVVLPPMLVEESKTSVPWLYVSVGGTEFLSRCSESITGEFVGAWLEKMQFMRVLAPENFLARADVPAVCVLYAQDLDQTLSAEIQQELQAAAVRQGEAPDGARVNLAPNMRLGDRDMHATIVYIDESTFDGSNLNISASHVRYLLLGRVPDLPTWLVDGLERIWAGADFVLAPITLGPLVWQNQSESDALASDRTHLRALLPASELFAAEPARAMQNQHPRRRQILAAQQELFVRWAIVSSSATREALWKFAARAAEGPVTEEIFEACFGFDFSELRDRLSDYLPRAVEGTKHIYPGTLPDLPRFKVERATPQQIARVRGEWERLAIWHVQRRLPQAREPYIAQARRTLRRAYSAGDRDPRLLAIMGLCEIDAGNPAGAPEFLEPAVAGGVVRPNAYYELARLRFADLQRGGPEPRRRPWTELAPIIQPLQRALLQAPPLPEIFVLLAEAWTRCEVAPSAAEFAELELGARLFAQRPTVAWPIALVLARHGKKTEATAVLDACDGHATDEKTQAGITRLRAELSALSRSAR
ncbi:MAG: hypothetical protein EXS32_04535 [Opitutus sp.]|nr:hypothetical protein [Opitutus sp.]